jgi:hypothetical protein
VPLDRADSVSAVVVVVVVVVVVAPVAGNADPSPMRQLDATCSRRRTTDSRAAKPKLKILHPPNRETEPYLLERLHRPLPATCSLSKELMGR